MVNHKKLFDVMLSMGIPRHIVQKYVINIFD